MDYNSYEDALWGYKIKKYKPKKQEEQQEPDLFYSEADKGYKLERFRTQRDPKVDTTEKHHDAFTDISEDTLLVAKQFMVFAHLRCPKPPVRFARGLLSSTIRVEPTYYLGMNGCVCKCGNAQAFYMPFTNEEWKSAKAYPVGKESYYKKTQFAWGGNWKKSMKEYASYMAKEYNQDGEEYYKRLFKLYEEQRTSLVRKNPNEHWWDKAIQDTVNLCQERGVMMNG